MAVDKTGGNRYNIPNTESQSKEPCALKKGRSLGGAALAVLLLALLVLYALRFMLPAPAPGQPAAEPSPLPQETAPPPTAAPVPTAAPTPQPTPEPPPQPTPAPPAGDV